MNKEEWLGLLEFEARWLLAVLENRDPSVDIGMVDSLAARLKNLLFLYQKAKGI